jgi:hypothetical protein
MMNNKIKRTFLLAAFGAMGMASLQAGLTTTAYNQDLLVGFTKFTGNDLIYDLGAESSLTNGKTWNLSTLLASYTLSTVNWGVIGDNKTAQTPNYAVYTTLQNPPIVYGSGDWNQIDTPTRSIYQNFSAAGAGHSFSISTTDENSWYAQMESPSLTTQYGNAYGNPDVTGLTTVSFNPNSEVERKVALREGLWA